MTSFIELTDNLESSFHDWNGWRPFLSKEKVLGLYRDFTTQQLEVFFFELCMNFEITQFIECGAYDAHASKHIKKLIPDAHVIAFEANPFVYKNFKNEIKSCGIHYLNSAISNKLGTTDLVIKTKDTKSWSNEGFLQTVSTENIGHDKLEVKTTTLDSELERNLLKNPTALWIDVEGSNRLLIEGSQNILQSGIIEVIFIESQVETVWDQEFTAEELCDNLMRFGYTPIARDCPFHWGCNLIFIKSNADRDSRALLRNFNHQLEKVQIPYFAKLDCRSQFSELKRKMLNRLSASNKMKAHKVFSLLGSKSSLDEISVQ